MSEKEKQIVTSLRVNAKTWKQAKIEAIKEDLTLAELVDEALKEWIKKKQSKKVGA
jgi:hypothetical protein